jgi:hypothetical protein
MLWAYAPGTDAYPEHTCPELVRALASGTNVWCAQSAVPSKHAEHTHQELMRTMSIRLKN